MNQKSKEEGATEPPAPEEQLTDDTNKGASAPTSQTSTKSVDKGKSPKTGKSDDGTKKPATLTPDQFNKLLSLNPTLKKEVHSMEPTTVQKMMNALSLADGLAGASIRGEN